MQILNSSVAGTLESSDCMITIDNGDGITIDLTSSVEKQFGRQIEAVIKETLATLGVTNAAVTINDKGALDCTIKARLKAAIMRATGSQYAWEV